MSKQLKEFEAFLSVDQAVAPHTAYSHACRMGKFQRWLGRKPFNITNCRQYLHERQKTGVREATTGAYIISFRHYANFLGLKDNFAYDLKLPKPSRRSPQLITSEELNKILNTPQKTRLKDKFKLDCVFILLAATGMRVSEALNLRVADVNFSEKVITIRQSKTRSGRLVPIPYSMARRLLKLTRQKKGSDFIFEGREKGSHLGREAVWAALKRRLKKAGIRKRIHPHSFRHSVITEMLRQDVSVMKIQRIVGHTQLATTQGYGHLVFSDLRDAIRKNRLVKGIE